MPATLNDLDVKALCTSVLDRLVDQVPGMTLDTDDVDGNLFFGEPTHKLEDDRGYVDKYMCLYPGPGTPSYEQNLAVTGIDMDWSFQLTCAAGWIEDVLDLIRQAHAALYTWTPSVDGLVCGFLAPPLGFTPGSILYDRDFTPHRPYAPLQYGTRVTAN